MASLPLPSPLKSVQATDPIYVTQPFLPDLSEFLPYLETIWRNKVLTNGGQFHVELEAALCEYLGVDFISLFANGTLALVTALQSLRITGEVITTPYSFVASSNALRWNGITPVFADICRSNLNLDPERIEAAITPHTTAIMPVHCYGHPCDVLAIQELADRYNLRVVYDAAHAFGVKLRNKSILRHGDLSVLSFHATKVFTTFEGGAIVCPDRKTKMRIDHLKNFGIVDEVTVVAPGINGKMSEINAAFGLVQIKFVDQMIERRRAIEARYKRLLAGVAGIGFIETLTHESANASYCPILIGKNFPVTRDRLYEILREKNVIARRYFYPLISTFPMYRGHQSSNPSNLPIATEIAEQVICIPIHPNLSDADVDYVAQAIMSVTT